MEEACSALNSMRCWPVGYDVQARKNTDVGAPAAAAATVIARSSSVLAPAGAPRAGAVVRQGGFGRRNTRA
jgi:hypothetical protein